VSVDGAKLLTVSMPFYHFTVGCMIGVLSLEWIFSLRDCIQTCTEAHPASYPMGTRSSIPDSKAEGV